MDLNGKKIVLVGGAGLVGSHIVDQLTAEPVSEIVVFDNFLHRLLKKLRTDKETKHKHIVVLMDNATIHKHSSIYETARRFKVNVLLNAQYSPWLNPVE